MTKKVADAVKKIAREEESKIQSVNYSSKTEVLNIRVATYVDRESAEVKESIIGKGTDRASRIIKAVEEKTGIAGKMFTRRYQGFINDICVRFE